MISDHLQTQAVFVEILRSDSDFDLRSVSILPTTKDISERK